MAATNEERRFMKAFISNKSSESFVIPVGFNEYFPNPLPLTVDLIDHCGRSWTVRMKKRGDQVFLTIGWGNFVKDKDLEDGKYLNFIYDCNRTFYVIVFGHSGCNEFIDFPQAEMDVDDYEISEEEEDEVKQNITN